MRAQPLRCHLQNEPPRRSRSTQTPYPLTKRASPEIPLNSNPIHPPTQRPLRGSHSTQIPHPPTKRAPPQIPLNSNSTPTHKTSTPGDPAQFKCPTRPQNEHPSYIWPWAFLYQGRHSIRSLTPTLEHCQPNPSGATRKTSIPGHRARLKLFTHPQNVNSNSTPTHETSPPGDPAQIKCPTHPPTKRAPLVYMLQGRGVDVGIVPGRGFCEAHM